jgi:hypothetical protein
VTSGRHPTSRQVCLGLSPWLFSIADTVTGRNFNSVAHGPSLNQTSRLRLLYCTNLQTYAGALPRATPPSVNNSSHPVYPAASRSRNFSKTLENSNTLLPPFPTAPSLGDMLWFCIASCALRLVTCEHVPGFAALRLPLCWQLLLGLILSSPYLFPDDWSCLLCKTLRQPGRVFKRAGWALAHVKAGRLLSIPPDKLLFQGLYTVLYVSARQPTRFLPSFFFLFEFDDFEIL